MSALISGPTACTAIASAIVAQQRVLRAELVVDGDKPKRGRVHRLRVAARRLLAALELAAALGVSVPRAAPRRLEGLLESLSPLRDAQVMQRGLERLPEAQVERGLLRRVRRMCRKQRARAGKRLGRFELERLEVELSRVAAALAAAGHRQELAALALTGFLAKQQLTIEGRRSRARQASPRELHQLRLALKAYRYTLEILAAQLPDGAQGLLELTSTLQDELGSAHDRLVLCELVSADAEARDSERSRQLAEQLEASSSEAHARAAEHVCRAELPWPLAAQAGAVTLSHTKSAP